MTHEIHQTIGTVGKFGYLLEDGHNILEDHILLGGAIDEEGEAEKPHYFVTSAWREGDLVMVNASLIENESSNQEKAQELLKLYNEAEEKLFRGGKDYQQIGDHEFENLEYQIRECGYELEQPKIGLSTLKPIMIRPIEQIDQELKAVQSVECVVNKCDSIDREACGHTTEINHEVPEDSIYPFRPQGDVCSCRCHALYTERSASRT